MNFNILAVGDVVGACGVRYLEGNLRRIKKKYDADLVIVNGENSADANGISRKSAISLFDAGADVITGGNHSLRCKDVYSLYESEERLLIPANISPIPVGNGYVIIETSFGRVLVISVLGQMFMNPAESPFYAVEKILKSEYGKFDLAVADIHAEATSEKLAFLRYFADRFQVIFGTHTHVQTADETVLGSCGYITDLGMCGAVDSILGTVSAKVVDKFVKRTPEKFELADGRCVLTGAVFTIDSSSKNALQVKRIIETE